MSKYRAIVVRLLFLALTLTVIVSTFFLIERPWYLRWGATAQELRNVLPGDEIFPNAAQPNTRAITIHAPITDVWPWVAQIGQDRGGFYSYSWLERMVGGIAQDAVGQPARSRRAREDEVLVVRRLHRARVGAA